MTPIGFSWTLWIPKMFTVSPPPLFRVMFHFEPFFNLVFHCFSSSGHWDMARHWPPEQDAETAAAQLPGEGRQDLQLSCFSSRFSCIPCRFLCASIRCLSLLFLKNECERVLSWVWPPKWDRLSDSQRSFFAGHFFFFFFDFFFSVYLWRALDTLFKSHLRGWVHWQVGGTRLRCCFRIFGMFSCIPQILRDSVAMLQKKERSTVQTKASRRRLTQKQTPKEKKSLQRLGQNVTKTKWNSMHGRSWLIDWFGEIQPTESINQPW